MAERRGAGQWLRRVPAGPSGKVRVQLSPDFDVDLPVEVEVPVKDLSGPTSRAALALVGATEADLEWGLFGYVGPEMLGISSSLAEELRVFQRWWEEHGDPFGDADDEESSDERQDPEWQEWEHQGRDLVRRLQDELGPRYDVSWPTSLPD